MSRINVMQPFLGAEEIAAVTEVISSGWVAQGPRVAAFESRLRRASAGRPCGCGLQLHDGAAPGAGRRRCQGRR